MPADASPQYFPKHIFSKRADLSDFQERWYAAQLRAMHEPSLLDLAKDKSTLAYRFVWLRTFHHPIAVRLVIRPDGTGQLTSTEMTGAGGYNPGVLAHSQTRDVLNDEVIRFQALLHAIDYWSMPTDGPGAGFDGAEWILEGVHGGEYHVVTRWSPETGAYREACWYLLELSKFEVNPGQVY
jgi:hypothetical protein